MNTETLRSQRTRAKQQVTLIGGGVNLLLAVGKVVAGYYGHSQALIVDGIHSFSDLATDLLLLTIFRVAGHGADDAHPYGHGRFETIAAVILGLFLATLAGGIIWNAAQRLQGEAPLLTPHPWVIIAAVISILTKETLYQYTIHVARRTRSKLLQANAWHHRSDAVSSIVVLIGVVGTFYGYHFADAVAAIVVGLMIARIGLELVIDSSRELVDTALPSHQVQAIEHAILGTEGVESLHSLRTRRMAGEALVDVHIQVHPDISVSEGHAIADKVRDRLLEEFEEVTDVTVHIDAERDIDQSSLALPLRSQVIKQLTRAWRHLPYAKKIRRITLHYLKGRIDLEVYLPLEVISVELPAKKIIRQLREAAKRFNFIRSIQVYFTADDAGHTKKDLDAP